MPIAVACVVASLLVFDIDAVPSPSPPPLTVLSPGVVAGVVVVVDVVVAAAAVAAAAAAVVFDGVYWSLLLYLVCNFARM